MKFILNHRWLRPDERLTALVKQKISRLSALVRIEAAEITLARNMDSLPPFSAKVRLAVPGPDLYSEGNDYTPEAAIHKVLVKLTRQIRHRKRKRLTKRRSGEECGSWTEVALPLELQTA